MNEREEGSVSGRVVCTDARRVAINYLVVGALAVATFVRRCL